MRNIVNEATDCTQFPNFVFFSDKNHITPAMKIEGRNAKEKKPYFSIG
jgi:hypothetical protein|tara:strand:+ start:278 stop:421 length:144 start_codon:yes stop_codon:yes gene_type:complete